MDNFAWLTLALTGKVQQHDINISTDRGNHDFFCDGVMYSGEYDDCDVTLSVYPHRANLNRPDRTYSNHILEPTDPVAQLTMTNHILEPT
jgi:hypothetical protein